MPFGSMSFENATNERGECLVWLEPHVVDRLRHLRRRGPRACSLFRLTHADD